jgi:predicted small metal-binding protein
MVKILKCEGINPDRNFEALGRNEEEVLQHVSVHVKVVHHMKEIPPAVLSEVRRTI